MGLRTVTFLVVLLILRWLGLCSEDEFIAPDLLSLDSDFETTCLLNHDVRSGLAFGGGVYVAHFDMREWSSERCRHWDCQLRMVSITARFFSKCLTRVIASDVRMDVI